MKFSLLNNGKYWLQDYIGTIEGATERAKQIKEKNSEKIDINICEEVTGTNPEARLFDTTSPYSVIKTYKII